jgi:protein SCO1
VNKTAVLGLLVALLLPLIGYFIIDGFTDRAVTMPRHYIYDSVTTRTIDGKQVTDTAWHRLPDFNLTNQLGREVGWDDIGAKVTVANFFFTRCPTICPQIMLNTKQLQDGIKSSEKTGNRFPDFIQFLSFTVDPERDSVRDLKKWADRFQINPENWWLLTGEKKEIYDLSIEHMKLGLVDGEGIDTGFFHTDYMVLIDRNRNIRGYYHGLDTVSVGKLSRDIILLALEKDPNRKKFFEGKFQMFAVLFLLTLAGLAVLFLVLKKDKRTHGITGKK